MLWWIVAPDTISAHDVSVKILRRFRAEHSCPHHKIFRQRRAVCRLAFGFSGPPCFLLLLFFFSFSQTVRRRSLLVISSLACSPLRLAKIGGLWWPWVAQPVARAKVDEEHMGQGLGGMLIDAAEQHSERCLAAAVQKLIYIYIRCRGATLGGTGNISKPSNVGYYHGSWFEPWFMIWTMETMLVVFFSCSPAKASEETITFFGPSLSTQRHLD